MQYLNDNASYSVKERKTNKTHGVYLSHASMPSLKLFT